MNLVQKVSCYSFIKWAGTDGVSLTPNFTVLEKKENLKFVGVQNFSLSVFVIIKPCSACLLFALQACSRSTQTPREADQQPKVPTALLTAQTTKTKQKKLLL